MLYESSRPRYWIHRVVYASRRFYSHWTIWRGNRTCREIAACLDVVFLPEELNYKVPFLSEHKVFQKSTQREQLQAFCLYPERSGLPYVHVHSYIQAVTAAHAQFTQISAQSDIQNVIFYRQYGRSTETIVIVVLAICRASDADLYAFAVKIDYGIDDVG